MKHIKNLLIGVVLGVANVIPGVSAGTMAVILNIYDKLLSAISMDKNQLKKNASFLSALGIGAIVGIILFSNAIEYLFREHNMVTNFAFVGIVIGSIPMIINHAKESNTIKAINFVPTIITFTIMVMMAVSQGQEETVGVMLELNAITGVWLMISGAVSAFAMIIPGISGSFIMLTLGTYSTVIGSIANFTKDPFNATNLSVIAIIGIGVLIGLGAGVNIVKILLKKYKQATYMAILGLVAGSVLVIYPGFTFDSTGIISLGMMCIGAAIALKFSDK